MSEEENNIGLSLLVGKLEGRMESIMRMQEDISETLASMEESGEISRRKVREEIKEVIERLNNLEQLPRIAAAQFSGFKAGAAFMLFMIGSGAGVVAQRLLEWFQGGWMK